MNSFFVSTPEKSSKFPEIHKNEKCKYSLYRKLDLTLSNKGLLKYYPKYMFKSNILVTIATKVKVRGIRGRVVIGDWMLQILGMGH